MARGTVSEAYRRLAEQGRVRSRAGGGTVVVTAAQARTTDTDSRRTAPLRLSRGMPDLAAWLSAEREVLDHWAEQIVPLPVDGYGLEVDAPESSGLRQVLVTPAHQFPTSAAHTAGRRTRLRA